MIERATSRLDLQPPIIVRAERCAAGALNKHTLSDLWATNSTCCHPTTIALSHGTWCFHIGYSALRARAQFRMRYLRGSQRASSARGWHFGARNTRNWWLCTRFRVQMGRWVNVLRANDNGYQSGIKYKQHIMCMKRATPTGYHYDYCMSFGNCDFFCVLSVCCIVLFATIDIIRYTYRTWVNEEKRERERLKCDWHGMHTHTHTAVYSEKYKIMCAIRFSYLWHKCDRWRGPAAQ